MKPDPSQAARIRDDEAKGPLKGGLAFYNNYPKDHPMWKKESSIDATQKELIHKLAFVGPAIDAALFGVPSQVSRTLGEKAGRKRREEGEKLDNPSLLASLLVPGHSGYRAGKVQGYSSEDAGHYEPRKHKKEERKEKKEASDMRNIIDDIIKGAKDNTFGRPVNIQMNGETPDWTPLDTAKCAGMLIALDEQGYTLKEASEFLGLTEERLQEVIKSVG